MMLEPIEPIQDNLELMFYWGQDFHAFAAESYREGMAILVQVCFDEALLTPHFAIENDTAVGFVYFKPPLETLPDLPDACALYVVIAPEFRPKGYSHTMIALATELAHAHGWPHVVAEVPKQDAILARVFSGLGFEFLREYEIIQHEAKPITQMQFVHRG